MLGFFRRHQRIFFFGTTFVIIVSFVFFGTYSSITRSSSRDNKVATTLGGKTIKYSDMEKMNTFIRSDQLDSIYHAGRGGFNFLNDGVIQKDFLESGLAVIALERYSSLVSSDLKTRMARERSYSPYIHPKAKFINADTAWTYFAPDLKGAYDRLKQQNDPVSRQALQARAELYLQEKKFPSFALKQVLEYQESQYNWIEADPNLRYGDLNLFGYNTVEDWFGIQAMHLFGFIIYNGAEIAQEKGYKVTDEEVHASLVSNAEASFKANASNPYFEYTNTEDYYREQLRLMNMSEGDAVAVWKKVLLFRRYFQDVSSSVFVDNLAYASFDTYAKKSMQLSAYEMDISSLLTDAVALQQLDAYLKIVADAGSVKENPLGLPSKFLSAAEIEQKNPAFIQRSFELEIAQFDKESLQGRVSIKQMWDWEIQEDSWKMLTAQFPELQNKKAATADDRLAILDSFDKKVRSRIDNFARSKIADQHPEWLDEALAGLQTKREIVNLRLAGSKQPLKGVKDPAALIKLLDEVALYDQSSDDAMSGTSSALQKFSGDGRYYYRIRVLNRSAGKEIVAFADAMRDGSLDALVDKALEGHYKIVRETDTKTYQNDKKEWKPIAEVRAKVAESYSKSLLDMLASIVKEANADASIPAEGRARFLAPYRFYKYVDMVRQQAVQGQDVSPYIADGRRESSFENQWKLIKTEQDVRRDKDKDDTYNIAYTMTPGSWSKTIVTRRGDLIFFKVDRLEESMEASNELMTAGQKVIGASASQIAMQELLEKIDASHLIGPDFMKRHQADESDK